MPVKIDPDALYSEAEFAAIVDKTPNTVRKERCRDSRFQFIKYGRRVFYRGSDIIAGLEAGLMRSTSDVQRPRAGF